MNPNSITRKEYVHSLFIETEARLRDYQACNESIPNEEKRHIHQEYVKANEKYWKEKGVERLKKIERHERIVEYMDRKITLFVLCSIFTFGVFPILYISFDHLRNKVKLTERQNFSFHVKTTIEKIKKYKKDAGVLKRITAYNREVYKARYEQADPIDNFYRKCPFHPFDSSMPLSVNPRGASLSRKLLKIIKKTFKKKTKSDKLLEIYTAETLKEEEKFWIKDFPDLQKKRRRNHD